MTFRAPMFALVLLALVDVLSAAPLRVDKIRTFAVSAGELGGIVAGPDGNMWFTETVAGRIGRITLDGVITEFALPRAGVRPTGIAAGADGNLWFTEANGGAIGRITLNGVITEFSLPPTGFTSQPIRLAAGPDGNIWYTHIISRIGRISPAGAFAEFGVAYDYLFDVTGGPDGNVWFTVSGGYYESKICRVTPQGQIVQFWSPLLTYPGAIITGPDGNLWFTQSDSLVRLTPSGVFTAFAAPGAAQSIVVGSDGNLWFATGGPTIERMTTAGVVLPSIALPQGAGRAVAMAQGPNGSMWYVDASGTIGRIGVSTEKWRRN